MKKGTGHSSVSKSNRSLGCFLSVTFRNTRVTCPLFLAAVVLFMPAAAFAQKLVFVVRHAERADAGLPAQTDPPLSAAGEARAQKLAAMLAETGVKDIFATELKRTQDTAKPLAMKIGVAVEQVGSKDTAGLIAKIKSHPNDVVLVVGHSNTVPAILKALAGVDVPISDNEYDNLFVVVPATGTMTRIRY
jgi:broad specificity phosphatase PhoE